jgi:cyclopropane fatty-acyl-phospholipid synthase-like methyltransferase
MIDSGASSKEKTGGGSRKFIAESLVRELYQGTLEREPNNSELSAWTAAIESSGGVVPMLKSLLKSSEFRKKSVLAGPEFVRAAYKGILGREADPEGLKTYADQLSNELDFASLLKVLTESTEFENNFSAKMLPRLRHQVIECLWSTEPRRVDTEATAEQFEKIFQRIREQWTELGDTEPHWSVTTHENYKVENFAKHEEEFYESGVNQVAILKGIIERAGLELNPAGTVLELGCGTGRMTHAFAKEFGSVIAVDISPGNMRLCQEKLGQCGKTNVEFVLLQSPEEIANLQPFDFFYSTIVLQHNPPPVITYFLDQILGKIRRSGIAFFQVPTHHPGYSFDMRNLPEYLVSPPSHGMELHCVPMPAVFSLLAKHGLTPVEVLMDGATGMSGSHTFIAVRG